jgi:hypothetical protein
MTCHLPLGISQLPPIRKREYAGHAEGLGQVRPNAKCVILKSESAIRLDDWFIGRQLPFVKFQNAPKETARICWTCLRAGSSEPYYCQISESAIRLDDWFNGRQLPLVKFQNATKEKARICWTCLRAGSGEPYCQMSESAIRLGDWADGMPLTLGNFVIPPKEKAGICWTC